MAHDPALRLAWDTRHIDPQAANRDLANVQFILKQAQADPNADPKEIQELTKLAYQLNVAVHSHSILRRVNLNILKEARALQPGRRVCFISALPWYWLMSFDYDAKNEIDVSFVADAIRSSHRLAPLTDEQKLQRQIEREIRREEQAWLAEERRIERERQQAEAEAIAKKEAAIAGEQARQKVRREFRERDRERQREQQLVRPTH